MIFDDQINFLKLKQISIRHQVFLYFAKENFKFQRLEKQFSDKKQWIEGVPKLKTISQIFKERGGYELEGAVKGSELVGLKYSGPFDDLEAQSELGGYPFTDDKLKSYYYVLIAQIYKNENKFKNAYITFKLAYYLDNNNYISLSNYTDYFLNIQLVNDITKYEK